MRSITAQRETVAIVGSHPETRSQFNFDRTDCDVFVFNEAMSTKWAKHADVVFQMHQKEIWSNPGNRNDPNHFKWLQNQTQVAMVMMQDQYTEVPASVKYPLDEIIAAFDLDYFTSSVAYALALACFRGYKRLELYGVEMATNTEYAWQREGVFLWIGVAKGMGIQCDLHTDLLKGMPRYGYDGEVSIPVADIEKRAAELAEKIAPENEKYFMLEANVKKQLDVLFERDNTKDLFAAVDALLQHGQKLGAMDGARQENEKYLKKAQTMIAASGGHAFSRQEFESAAAMLQKEAQNRKVEMSGYGGQLDLLHDNIIRSAKSSPKRAKFLEGYRTILGKYFSTNNILFVVLGAQNENFAYMTRLDMGIKAAGGERSEKALLEITEAQQ